MIRVVVSVPLPAANGSTSVMLRVGHAGACACATELKPASAMANAAAREASEIIPFLLPISLLRGLLAGKLACAAAKRKPVQCRRIRYICSCRRLARRAAKSPPRMMVRTPVIEIAMPISCAAVIPGRRAPSNPESRSYDVTLDSGFAPKGARRNDRI